MPLSHVGVAGSRCYHVPLPSHHSCVPAIDVMCPRVIWAASSGELTIYVDAASGRNRISGTGTPTANSAAAPSRLAPPLRIGAIGDADGRAVGFADVELGSAIAVLARTPSEDAIRAVVSTRGVGGCSAHSRASARADGGGPPPLVPLPLSADVLACYELREAGGHVVHDASAYARHGRIVNDGTWNVAGPSFALTPEEAAARADSLERWENAAPAAQSSPGLGGPPPHLRAIGSALRLASDDLYDCRWEVRCAALR